MNQINIIEYDILNFYIFVDFFAYFFLSSRKLLREKYLYSTVIVDVCLNSVFPWHTLTGNTNTQNCEGSLDHSGPCLHLLDKSSSEVYCDYCSSSHHLFLYPITFNLSVLLYLRCISYKKYFKRSRLLEYIVWQFPLK